MKYTVDYFIDKFSKIPNKFWITGRFDAPTVDHVKHCVLGHCWRKVGGPHTQESKALRNLFAEYFHTKPWMINDSRFSNNQFPQKTPRGRILAALKKIKKKSEIF